MATEGPLFHDGAQCTSSANYAGTSLGGSSFLGVGTSAQFLVVSISAARVVTICTGPTAVPYGILQNTPLATDAADVGIFGITKAVAGAAITAGTLLQAGTAGTLGQVVPWVTTNFRLGVAIEAASGQGVVFTMFLFPSFVLAT
jgi:hypothetical protein